MRVGGSCLLLGIGKVSVTSVDCGRDFGPKHTRVFGNVLCFLPIMGVGTEALQLACVKNVSVDLRFGDASWWVMVVVWDWQRWREQNNQCWSWSTMSCKCLKVLQQCH